MPESPAYFLRFNLVAERLRVSPKTLLDSIESGEVPLRLVRIGKRRIPHVFSTDLESFIHRSKEASACPSI